MNISVFGLGYVGIVTAACLAREGHSVVGVDVQPVKVDMINAGKTPIVEEKIADLIQFAQADGKLKATLDAAVAIRETDLAIVCVGTPSQRDGSLDNRYIEQVISEIGVALRDRSEPFHIVIRSTMIPGTLRTLVIPTLEKTVGRKLGDGFDVVFHPEFLREGTSVYDFYNPPKIVVGESIPGSSQTTLDLYSDSIKAPRIVCSLEIAEMVKYCDNLFHAVKVTFANEIGQFCNMHEIDSQKVMNIFCEDTKLNLSSKYLRPGFAFGGSCLPKDLRAFLSVSRLNNLTLPMLENIIPSNLRQIERALGLILASGIHEIGFYGISFKPGTDDLRESPLIELAERLLGKGKTLRIYDEKVQIARLLGGNQSYVQQMFPHLSDMLTDQIDILSDCGLVVVGHSVPETQIKNWLKSNILIVDLTGQYSHSEMEGLTCIV